MKFRTHHKGKKQSPGKKPGEAQKARKKHLARQARQDAISALKRGETVIVSAFLDGEGYKNFRVAPPDNERGIPPGSKVLLILERKLQVAEYYEKDGAWVSGSGQGYHVRNKQIFGVVVEN